MRKPLSLGVVIAALGLFPAAAQAHHVDLNASSATCALVANVPTVSVSVAYRSFEEFNKPVHWELRLNGTGVDSGVLTWPGPDYDHRLSRAVAPGEYDVAYVTTWGYGNSATLRQHVVCPTPVQPPVVICNGVQVPPGTVCQPPAPPPPVVVTVVYCNGVAMPAGTAPGACRPVVVHRKPCPCRRHPPRRCVPRHARVRVFPLRRDHGEVVFVLAGIRRADVVSVRWTVRRPGHSWRGVGHSGRAWEQLTHHGLSWHVFLWVERVWGFPQLGHHQVRATARVRTACGRRTIVRTMTFLNHDPEPRARHWD